MAIQLSLIFLIGLSVAQALSFGAQYYERYQTTEWLMLHNLQTDVSTSIAILDRLPANERQGWLKRLNRDDYEYLLDEGVSGSIIAPKDIPPELTPIADGIGSAYALTLAEIPGPIMHFQARLKLSDGEPVTIDVWPAAMPLSGWLLFVMLGQLATMIACTWLAVRVALRPLRRLSDAAEKLDPTAAPVQLREQGPEEVVHAAKAFNTMQERISMYVKERVQLLAAISHDLQTPITRMKLRAELAEPSDEKDKLLLDLSEIEHLVNEGIAYARSIHGVAEDACRLNLDSFLESLVFDYQDAGKAVTLSEPGGIIVEARPHALRRILVNLVDNAIKFSGSAEVNAVITHGGALSISVLDRGPGIAEEQLDEVFKPFYRVESSRNRSTGGTGLGLAIAQQLSQAIGGSLVLSNRVTGGLCATLCIKPERD
jgi:signal transduction histidine kinase